MRKVISVILGGGQGARLFPLTQYRSKPAVPIGGKYRLIDIPISNCIHSGVDKMFVLTQFNSASLNRHVGLTYRFDNFGEGFVEILAAEQTMEDMNWYQGTADAVRKQLRRIHSRRPHQVLILSGDHLYRMDYRAFIEEHRQRQADVSIAVKPVRREEASGLGILKVDDEGRIVAFCEKPQTDEELDALELPSAPGDDPDARYLASMGIYIFEPSVLTSLLVSVPEDDFGKHIIPRAIESLNVFAHTFDGYWEDIGTIGAFYRSNITLASTQPSFEFHKPEAPIFTRQRNLAATRMLGCRVDRGIVAEGCVIDDAQIEQSVVGVRSIIGAGARLYQSIVMGADYYESPADRERHAALHVPPVGIGPGSVIHRAIVDKNARIGTDVVIRNEAGVMEADGEGYYIREGIVVIPKDGVIPGGMRI
ncbi:MAG: glucose-1-phosphate adenylyltransferase [Gemmatimonadetes bacterium]|jgi:glucose-1-phosphate adenylyltransferase|nr:glucose-1-phosphate adenylyltransferase [Gemmatimonadota bacterium]MBT6146578.1 glucose-1-phosphate adenylyltransferase [Gemmatimonadota bacterium]